MVVGLFAWVPVSLFLVVVVAGVAAIALLRYT